MKARENRAFGRPEYIANPNSEGAWTDWRHLEGMSWPLNLPLFRPRSVVSDELGRHSAKIIYRVKNRQIMPN